LCYDLSTARNSREHNNANVLTLGASLIGAGLARQIVDTFLNTECTAERHLRRAAMIDEIDRQLRGVGCQVSGVRDEIPTSDSRHPTPDTQQSEASLTELSE